MDQPVQQSGPAAQPDGQQAGGPGLHQVQEDAGGQAEEGNGAGGHAAGADEDATGAADETSAGADEDGAAAEDCEPPTFDLRPRHATVG